jgi:DNA-binding IclR family transcriptional regulator
VTWATVALHVFRERARTSVDIAAALGLTRGHAKVLCHNMARAGLIERRGYLPQDGRPGRRAAVYEVVRCP